MSKKIKLSGSALRKIHSIVTGTGKFSPSMIQKRNANRRNRLKGCRE